MPVFDPDAPRPEPVWRQIHRDLTELADQKNAAYHERDQLVAVLSKIWPAHLSLHEGEWEDDWRHIVCIHTPAGQATWHIHDSELFLFEHLEMQPGHWDGHTTGEKYARLASLPPRSTGANL